MSKMNITEATMLALQGRLPMKESKLKSATKSKKLKKENIDINVDDKTSVSAMDNEIIVDTEDATIIVDKKQDSLPVDNVVEVPVESEETIIPEELPETEEIVDAPVDTMDIPVEEPADIDLPLEDATEPELEEESKIVESKEEEKEKLTPTWVIQGLYDRESGWDDLVTEYSKEEAEQTLQEYNENETEYPHRIRKVYVKENKKVESKKLQEEVSNDAYTVADAIAKEFEGKELVTWDEFSEALEKFMKELDMPENFFNEDLAEFETDVRVILSTYGFATIFEGDNEGGLTTVIEDKKEESVLGTLALGAGAAALGSFIGNKLSETEKLEEDLEMCPFRNMIFNSITDDVDDAETVADRLTRAWSEDDCKWYCETYELVNMLPNASDEKYYKDIWGNYRDITGQIVEEEANELEEAKQRKAESLKKTEVNEEETEDIKECELNSFTEMLNKCITKSSSLVESVNVTKAQSVNGTLKLEAVVTSKDKVTSNLSLELEQKQVKNKFTKYSVKENKANNNYTLLTYTNKDNILECRYINKV